MKTVLVQMADVKWTIQAMHLACAVARNYDRSVVLLRLIHVSTPRFLGSDLNVPSLSDAEESAIMEYMSVAEAYGVEIELQPVHYESLSDALVQAARALKAGAVFARLPRESRGWWGRLRLWFLQRQLGVPVYTLERSERMADYTPSITIERAKG
jgi:hypothetical protein